MAIMRPKTLACLLMALGSLFAFTPKAEAKQDAFKDVPMDSWTYVPQKQEALELFKDLPRDSWAWKAFFKLRDQFMGKVLFSSGRITRYEVAVALFRIQEKMEKIDADALARWRRASETGKTEDAGKSDKNAPDISIEDRELLKKLVGEFWREMMAIGCFHRLSPTLSDRKDAAFEYVKEHSRFGYAVDIVWKRLTGSPFFVKSLFSDRRYYTRYEVAVRFQRIFKAKGSDLTTPAAKFAILESDDRALCLYVLNDLKKDIAFLAVADPFPDVPKEHWAYNAVTSLKRRGVLVGYPDPIANTFLPPQTELR